MSCRIEHVQEAKLRAEELRSQINHHDYLYYIKNEPEVSDTEYDELMRRLRAIEEHYPGAHHPRIAHAACPECSRRRLPVQ